MISYTIVCLYFTEEISDHLSHQFKHESYKIEFGRIEINDEFITIQVAIYIELG